MKTRVHGRPETMPLFSAGFTLLEILVATAILGAAVAGLFGLLTGSLGNMRRLRGPSQALLIGETRMNELLAAGIATGKDMPGTIPLDQKIEGQWNDQYRWEALATRFHPPEHLSPGQRIMVRFVVDVFWKPNADSAEKKLSLESYEFQIEPQPPAQ